MQRAGVRTLRRGCPGVGPKARPNSIDARRRQLPAGGHAPLTDSAVEIAASCHPKSGTRSLVSGTPRPAAADFSSGLLRPAYLGKVSDSYQRTWPTMAAPLLWLFRPSGIGRPAAAGLRRWTIRAWPLSAATSGRPFDGQPLRWRLLDDGVEVIQSGPTARTMAAKWIARIRLRPARTSAFAVGPGQRRQPPAPLSSPQKPDDLVP